MIPSNIRLSLARIAAVFATLALVGLGCDNEIGDRCDQPGSTGECVSGGICTNDSGYFSTCRQLCNDHPDCPAGFQCNGVSNSNLKSCQPG